ncbi:MAG TPA: glycoside hydrolase family 38 C-terminal domain-containing protein [Acidobacteriaceae bacterium]|nr:glycoside hydrolase family 38 C-terminal domain-containing protein [Acidobacteriaceae bacterium]
MRFSRLGTVALAVCVAGSAALAQRPAGRPFGNQVDSVAQTAAALNALSPQAQAVMQRLSEFGTWTVTDFKYHEGDVPNAAAVDLDDSSWQTGGPSTTLPPGSVVWIRYSVVVPKLLNGYDLTAAKITLGGGFGGGFGGRGMQGAMYINGQPVARPAAGAPPEPTVVFESAKPGDKVLIATRVGGGPVRPGGGGGGGRGGRGFGGRALRMEITIAPGRPDPELLHTEFLTAALVVPAVYPPAPSGKEELERAITDVDLKALENGDQTAFDASIRKGHDDLNVLKPVLDSIDFHLTGNSHIDAAWTWPWTETVDVVNRTFTSAINLMNQVPQYTYTQSAAQYNQWVADKNPRLNAQIKQRIDEGRWELVGGMWIEPDLNMPSGESLVRQILIGQRTFQKLYGVTTRIGWNPDSFGYNWQLPQIYKRSGIDYFVTQKMGWNDTNNLPLKLFWWQSPDGSKVLAYFPDGYGNSNFQPTRLANDFVHAQSVDNGIHEFMDLYGVGDHGGGPTRELLDEGLKWMQPQNIIPKMTFGTAQSFFTNIEGKISDNSPVWNYRTAATGDTKLPDPPDGKLTIPTWNDELYLEFHRGVYTTQSHHKKNMRDAEEQVINAEKWSSIAWLSGQSYPADQLTDAWKKVLFNQFHDLAAGSGIAVIYRDAQKDYDDVRWATDEATSNAVHTIQSSVDTRVAAGSVPVLVFNPLAWERSGLFEADVELPAPSATGVSVYDSQGKLLPSEVLSSNKKTGTYHLLIEAQHVPSMGYEVLHASAGSRHLVSDLTAHGFTLENSFLRVTVDPKTGCITSLYDKQGKFESLAAGGCGNQLEAFEDHPRMFDAWNIDPDYEQHPYDLGPARSVKLIESGPLRAIIEVTHATQKSTFVQDITLYAGMDRVDIGNKIDWHEQHVILKAAFPLSASSPMATYEIPFGNIQRPTTRNNSWEDAKFEVSAIRWADLGDSSHGFSLLNNSKYGYDAKGNVLRLTLLRAPTDPDPTADQGEHQFVFALYPHSGTWQKALTERQGWDFNYKLAGVQVQAHTGTLPAEHSFFSIDASDVVLTAIKKAEDSNALIVRFYEWAGKDANVGIQLPKGVTSATLTNLMEKPEGSPLQVQDGDKVTVPAHPYEIVTVEASYNPQHQ